MQNNDILRFGLITQRIQHRVTHIAAVPIILAFNFHSLENVWKTGRSQDDLGRNFTGMKHSGLAGADIGRTDEEFGFCPAFEFLKIDRRFKDLPQRVVISRVELSRV
jgi:hypothetical protein